MHYTDKGISDEVLTNLANEFETQEHVDKLGVALGFKRGEINRFLLTNRMGISVTYRGTLNMLLEWRQKHASRDQECILKETLQKVELIDIADRYFSKPPSLKEGKLYEFS